MNGVTGTAQALTMLSSLNSYQLISYGIAALLGLLLAPSHQAVIEGLVSKFPLPFWVKPFIPTTLASIVSSVAAWALKNYSVTPGDAVAAAASLSFFTHIWNATPWSANLTSAAIQARIKAGGVPTPKSDRPAAQTADPAPKSAFAFLLVAFLGLGAALHADTLNLNLSQNFGAGASVYSQNGGDFHNTGIEATTYGLNLSVEKDIQTGTTVTAQGVTVPVIWADNYFIVSAGASWEPYIAGSTDGYIGAYFELGTSIPLTAANLMVGGIGNFGTGLENPFALVASVNFQIGNLWYQWHFL